MSITKPRSQPQWMASAVALSVSVVGSFGCAPAAAPNGTDAPGAEHHACATLKPASEQLLAGLVEQTGGTQASGERSVNPSMWLTAARTGWHEVDGVASRFGNPKTSQDLYGTALIANAPRQTRGARGARVYQDNVTRVAMIQTEFARGSGILVEHDLVVTNYHVVAGQPTLLVFFKPTDDRELRKEDAKRGKVVAVSTRKDLALVEFKDPDPWRTPARLGMMDSIEVGSNVYAIGHPESLFWSFTTGVVSQIRTNHHWTYDRFAYFKATFIQTQTPINPGNSGGPLFNRRGELIGINTWVAEGEGLNFAVAVDEIRELLDERPPPPPRQPRQLNTYELIGHGHPDTIEFDVDGDGLGDRWHHDLSGDEKVDLISVDMTYNGIPNVFIYDTSGNNEPDSYCIDENEDGVIDYVLLDLDGDGKTDKSVRC